MTFTYENLVGLIHDQMHGDFYGFTAWVETPEGKNVKRLLNVYFDAQRNAPKHIIGVGRITYAENALKATQETNRIKLGPWGFGGQTI